MKDTGIKETGIESVVYKVGDIIDIYCGSCRLNLDGNVAAVQDGSVVQVVCRTCGNTQKYNPPVSDEHRKERLIKRILSGKDKKRGSASRAADIARIQTTATDVTSRWRKATDGVKSSEASIYRGSKTYEEGDVIIHSQHGLGIVSSILHENAMLVLFREVELPLEMGTERK